MYYENDKKNAIATKITAKAKNAVTEEINAAFVSTIAKTFTEVSGSATDTKDGTDLVTQMTNQLSELDQDLQSYITILDSFISVTNSASSLMETTQTVIPDLNSMVNNGQNTVSTMQGAVNAGTSSAQTVVDMVDYSLSMVSTNLDNVSSIVNSSISSIQGAEGVSDTGLSNAIAIMPYITQLFNNSVDSWKDQTTASGDIALVQNQFNVIQTDLNNLKNSTTQGQQTVTDLQNKIAAEIKNCKNQITSLQNTFDYSVKPQLQSTMDSMDGALNSVTAILNGVNGDFSDVSKVLSDYNKTLKDGNANLTTSRDMVVELKTGLDQIISQLKGLDSNEQYQELKELIKSDPTLLGEFMSSPVNLDTKSFYPIKNYGSAMAPFYTILAIWVGALILVAIIHVKVHAEPGIENVKPYQKYFGRYIIFFTTGQVQTLIVVLGDLFYLKIQCHKPFLFWLAAALSSFVFTLFIYSLTVAFGNIGEAIAVIVMVVQVAGTGGTFPIEVLPKVYQMIYEYLPFTYAINALRETVGGMYGVTYISCMLSLACYLLVALLIGLLIAIPFRKLNKMIEKSKEKTNLMV